MIENIRKYSNSWVVKAFLGLLGVCFAFLWGGNDALKMIGLSQDSTVAVVGNKKFSVQDLNTEVYRESVRMQMMSGQTLTKEQVSAMGLDREVTQQWIYNTLVALEAKDLGMDVSDEFLARNIQESKLFQTPDGKFSLARFNEIIRRFGFTNEAGYVGYMRSDTLRYRVLKALSGNAQITAFSQDPLYAWYEQTREIALATIKAAPIDPSVKITDDMLRDFYGKNLKKFALPERRTARVLSFSPKQFKSVTVTDTEVKDLYDVQKNDKFKNIPATEALKKIRAQLEADKLKDQTFEMSKKIEEAFASGTSLETLAKQYQGTILVINKAHKPLGQVTSLNDQAAAEAFDMEQGTLSPMNFMEDGTGYIVYVDAIHQPVQQTFQEAKEQVLELYKEQERARMTQVAAENAVTDAKKSSLRNVAMRKKYDVQGIKLSRTKPLSPLKAKLSPLTMLKIFSLPYMGSIAFQELNENNEPVWYVAQVVEIKPANLMTSSIVQRTEFKERMDKQIQSDVLQLYYTYLQKKFPVEVKERFFTDATESPKRKKRRAIHRFIGR